MVFMSAFVIIDKNRVLIVTEFRAGIAMVPLVGKLNVQQENFALC